jgi:2-isopropylmalate synthase
LVEHELGFHLPRRLQVAFSQVIQGITDGTGREIPSRDVAAKFCEIYVNPPATLVYHSHKPVERENDDELELYRFVVTFEGQKHEILGEGNGPLDAFVHALQEAFGLAYDIKDFQEHAMEAGSDSSAAAYILAKKSDGTELFGVGQHKSITKASLLALVAAINRSLHNVHVTT